MYILYIMVSKIENHMLQAVSYHSPALHFSSASSLDHSHHLQAHGPHVCSLALSGQPLQSSLNDTGDVLGEEGEEGGGGR